MPDAELLDLFLSGRDAAAEVAFEALVARHGSMVLRTCRRTLRDAHDAEDAFQAVFLVLANRGGAIRRGDSVASWLFGVAQRVAARLRRDAARRRARELVAAGRSLENSTAEGDDVDWEVLHREIADLPERLRSPIVLCYLQGLGCDAAAAQLGLSGGAVRGRLARARERLSDRLRRRGLMVPGGMALGGPTHQAQTAVPAALIQSTTRIALGFTAGKAAAVLARKVVHSMIFSKFKITVALACLGVGATYGTWQASAVVGPPAQPRPGQGVAGEPPASPQPPPAPVGQIPTGLPPAADPGPLQPGGDFELTVVGPGGKPVPGALVEFRADPRPEPGRIRRGTIADRRAYGTVVRADDDGRIAVRYPAVPGGMTLAIETPGYGPYWAQWGRTDHPEVIPARFTAELDAAWTVGGIVVDDAGSPVAGATVHPSIEFKKRPGDNSQMGTGASGTTDARGRWRFASVPADLTEVRVTIDKPAFRPFNEPLARGKYAVEPGREPSARIALGRGLTVTGRVLDDKGKPIVGATVRTKFHNEIRRATTGPDGAYRLEGCEPRATRIVVSAPGKAFDMRQVTVGPELAPVEFVMAPGNKLRIKVLDHEGKPEPRARIFFQRWRGEQVQYFEFDEINQYANDEGLWIWDEAPLDELKADICPRGTEGMQLVGEPLAARDAEYVFRLPPTLAVTGRVVDAETKEPIRKFRVVEGGRWANGDRTYWDDRAGFEATDGRYQVRNTRVDGSFLLRVEVEGYEAAASREIRADEGAVAVDFALKRRNGVALRFVTPDLKPAVGARVALGIEGAQIVVKGGDIDPGSTYADVRTTDAEGRVAFSARDRPFLLLALHPGGYARFEVAGAGDAVRPVKLEPWASVEGTFRIRPKPAANVRLLLDPGGFDSFGPGQPHLTSNYLTTTDAEGRYRFDRVFAGDARIKRDNTILLGEGSSERSSSIPSRIGLVGGRTTHFDCGGTGRVVVGKFAMAPGAAEPSDWSFAGISGQSIATDPGGSSRTWFTATIVRDATFRIDDLPPGAYALAVQPQQGRTMLTNFPFDVPPADPAHPGAPVDLGTITIPRADLAP